MNRRGFLGLMPLLAAASPSPAKVSRWDVITVGNLSRNRYWGEADNKAVREVLCLVRPFLRIQEVRTRLEESRACGSKS